ncbi:hypothetical protein NQ176_g11127 [Zarea fungicola]|uniref:Uncharacterized protein n=1 Tax=Zarea fungicola TaxID=93591 RepID=A0ACC1MBX0_9HYPO|nr:hypothetical protein NQ176_g11127 [Lecanicillium fungicola]
MLCLHRTDSYVGLPSEERELRLRVYWVLFVSERTYCIQHGLPTILRPISLRPSPKDGPDGCSGSPILSFLYLTKLFTFLDGDLIEPPSAVSPPNENGAVVGGTMADGSFDSQSARSKVSLSQSDLDCAEEGVGLDETQRVDIFVTRNWIRILLWEYTVRHFRMSCSADNEAFSIFLPALVAHEMLGFFSAVSSNSICAHGYGMELKVFRVADSLLDVLACRRQVGRADGMLLGSRDALHSLERVLSTVGGPQSLFLDKLRRRMGEVQLPVANTSWMQLPWPENRSTNVDEAEDCDAPQTDLELASGSLFELSEAAGQQFLGADMSGTELLNPPVFDYGNTQENNTWNEIR